MLSIHYFNCLFFFTVKDVSDLERKSFHFFICTYLCLNSELYICVANSIYKSCFQSARLPILSQKKSCVILYKIRATLLRLLR